MLHAVWHEFMNIATWPMNVGKHGGYDFWSGIGSGSPILVVIAGYARHHNCHNHKCWRLGHPHPDHHWPSCKRHWYETPEHISARSELDG